MEGTGVQGYRVFALMIHRIIPEFMLARRAVPHGERFRSRYLLPLEMCLAVQLVAIAMSGSMGNGVLHRLVAARDDPMTWGLVMGTIGFAWFCSAAIEWVFGKDWQGGVVAVSIWMRKWMSLAAMVSWSYITYTMVMAPEGLKVFAVFLIAPVMTLFSIWAWWVNARTETLLDPRLKTHGLEKSLEHRRLHW